MKTPLPSKDMTLQALAGTMAIQHPILQGAYELASLHEARVDKNADIGAIDRELDRLMSRIDSWVTPISRQRSMPRTSRVTAAG
jgi:hypothetical protein